MADNKQSLVSSFLEITADGLSPARATHYLQAQNWCLDDAVELFLSGAVVGDDDIDNGTPANQERSFDHDDQEEQDDDGGKEEENDDDENEEEHHDDGDDEGEVDDYDDNDELPEEYDPSVVPPSPVRRDILSYTSSMHSRQRGYEQAGGAIFPPPEDILFRGTFNDAKDAGIRRNKWLLVNVQSGRDKSSTLLNRNVWSNDVLAYLIECKFVFWQVDQAWPEGQKVCTYYKQNFLPAILVVDPITGRMMHSWTGVVEPEDLYVYLLRLSHQSPREHLGAAARRRPHEEAKETPPPTAPDEDSTAVISELPQKYERLILAKEPEGGDVVCRVGVRLPDGRRLQRRFLHGDSIRMLWSFCLLHLEEEAAVRGFHFILVLPGNSKRFQYDSDLSFMEAGVSNALLSLVWD